jgi:hypothetical protein
MNEIIYRIEHEVQRMMSAPLTGRSTTIKEMNFSTADIARYSENSPQHRKVDEVCGDSLRELGERQRRMISGDDSASFVASVFGPDPHEGVADWARQVTLAGALAWSLPNVGVHIEWAGVEIEQVLESNIIDWRSSSGLLQRCQTDANCTVINMLLGSMLNHGNDAKFKTFSALHGKNIDLMQMYFNFNIRTSFQSSRETYTQSSEAWDFPIGQDHASSCILNALFIPVRFNEKPIGNGTRGSAKHRVRLSNFFELFAAINQPRTCTISIYFRGFQSESKNDEVMSSDLISQRLPKAADRSTMERFTIVAAALCALRLEVICRQEFDQVVWVLISDDLELRETFVEEFQRPLFAEKVTHRTVLSSNSLGRHSRRRPGNLAPHQDSIFEAVEDWWIMGAAQIVVMGFGRNDERAYNSYPRTAAVRGGQCRSVYRPIKFSSVVRLIQDEIETRGTREKLPFKSKFGGVDSATCLLGPSLCAFSDESCSCGIGSELQLRPNSAC